MSAEEMRTAQVPATPVTDDWGEDWGDVTAPTLDVHEALTAHITDSLNQRVSAEPRIEAVREVRLASRPGG